MTQLKLFADRNDAAYPDRAGAKRRGTSQEAADHVEATTAGRLRLAVLASLRRNPATPDEIASRLGESVLSVRPRCTELLKKGLVERTDERRKNASGRAAHVLRLATKR